MVGPIGVAYGGTDIIRMYDETDVLQLSVAYSNSPNWPQEPNGLGTTLELVSASGIMNDADNWFSGCPNGSPGREFLPGCGVGLSSLDEVLFTIAPNPGSDQVFISSEEMGVIKLIDLNGQILLSQEKTTEKTQLDVNHLKAGLYFIQLNGATAQFIKL